MFCTGGQKYEIEQHIKLKILVLTISIGRAQLTYLDFYLMRFYYNNWEIQIVHKGFVISNMKTAGIKNCYLCKQERIVVFKAF